MWVRGLSFLCAAGVLAACSPSSGGGGGGGSDGGTTGAPGWHLSLPQDTTNMHFLAVVFSDGTGGGGTGPSAPDPSDPWLQGELTDKTLDLSADQGSAHGEAHATLAISGDTVTVTASATATTTSTTSAVTVDGFDGVTWCYRPASAASAVQFDITMDIKTLTVSGENALAYPQFSNWSLNTCDAAKQIDMGTETDQPASCTTDSTKITIYPGDDGEACLYGDSDDPKLDWTATGGSAGTAGGGTASVQVVYTVKATPIP